MLPKANRVVHGADFRRIVRSGRRLRSPVAVLHVTPGRSGVSRFGFVVTKRIGNAVVRNRIRRRMSEIVRASMPDEAVDVVVRALPTAATADFATLSAAITPLLRTR